MIICLTIMCKLFLNKKKASNEEIVVSKNTIYRDIGFYILSIIVTIIFALQGYIYWWSALVFLLFKYKRFFY